MTAETTNDISSIEARHGSGVYAMRAPALVKGRGAIVVDADGREYIDCSTGQGVAALGHGNARIAKAIAHQAEAITTVFASFPNDRRAELLQRWSARLPEGFERFFLCNSGTEAVEGAIKFARWSTGRAGIVAAVNGFHGRTLGSLSATWKPHYRQGFEPLVPGFQHAPFNRLDAWKERIDGQTAAVLIEIIQGEGGVRVADAEFLSGLRASCDEHGALLIVDEVQTGFGRTGRFLALEHFGLRPDLVCVGKAIAGGMPMGAVLIGPAVAELKPGIHGSTFGGNALACAAALEALAILDDEALVERAEREGTWLRERLEDLAIPVVRSVRGLGLMVGIDLKVPSGPFIKPLEDRGVLALIASKTVLRLLPPLAIERAQLETVVGHLEAVLREGSS